MSKWNVKVLWKNMGKHNSCAVANAKQARHVCTTWRCECGYFQSINLCHCTHTEHPPLLPVLFLHAARKERHTWKKWPEPPAVKQWINASDLLPPTEPISFLTKMGSASHPNVRLRMENFTYKWKRRLRYLSHQIAMFPDIHVLKNKQRKKLYKMMCFANRVR